ncbi:hypothetical protein BHE74_00046337 [Ensete ventricosum]|nr:hypothetical protein BHE74_00046337 [Ensete ventricosum]RZS25558.1 hypothetical protein BHM03_00058774 [Ensete ventricosum]
MNGKVINRGRSLSRRRVHKDNSRRFECRDDGHLSYECPRNQLGPRERPNPKRARWRRPRWGSDAGGSQRVRGRQLGTGFVGPCDVSSYGRLFTDSKREIFRKKRIS